MDAVRSLIESLAVIAYVVGVIVAVVRGCRYSSAQRLLHLESARSIPDAVARLAQQCRSFASERLVGSVERGNVRLVRQAKGVTNSFKPVFRGDFRQRGDKTVLVGEFGMAASTQAFLVFWYGMVGAGIIACLAGLLVQGRREAWGGLAMCVCLLAACVTLVRFAKRISADDIAWMTSVLKETLA